MRRILALALAVSLFFPPLAYAVDEILPTSAARTAPGSTQDVLGGTGPSASSQIAALAKSGQTDVVGCQTGGKGGALSGYFSQFTQQLVGNLIGKARQAVSKFAQKAGPLGGFIQQVADIGLNKLSGYLQSQLGGLANTLGQALGNTGLGGAINSLLGGGPLGGLLNGALGGVLGGVLGGGGAAIPVNTVSINDLINLIKGFTNRTADATETSAQVTCVGNVAVRQTAKAMVANTNKVWAEEAAKSLITNIPEYLQEGRDAVVKDSVDKGLGALCTKDSGVIKAMILHQYSVGNQVSCSKPQGGSGSANGKGSSAMNNIWNAANDRSASSIGQMSLATDYIQARLAEYNTNETTRILANGQFRGKVVCNKGEEPKGGWCPSGWKDTLPGSEYKEITHEVVKSGQDAAKQADEIGELPQQLMAALSAYVFQSLNGLMSLTSQGSDGAGGSYLDEAVNEAEGGSTSALLNAVGNDIEAAVSVEEEYLDTVTSVIASLVGIRNAYETAVACYQTKAQQGNSTALIKMNNASSTLATILKPEIAALTTLKQESEDALVRLKDLAAESQFGGNSQDIVAINAEYMSLVDAGLVHTQADLTELQNNSAAAADTLAALGLDASLQIAECQSL